MWIRRLMDYNPKGHGGYFILIHPKGGKNAQRIYGNARVEL